MLDIMRPPPHPWTKKAAAGDDDLTHLRKRIRDLAALIIETCPPSRERSEALDHLDAVAFHAVASFGRR